MEKLQAEMSQARQDFASEKKTVLELVVSCVSPPPPPLCCVGVWVCGWLSGSACAHVQGSTKEKHRMMAEKNEQLQK